MVSTRLGLEPVTVPKRWVHSSAVEHWIADPMVTGSIPVVPSFGAIMQGSLWVGKGSLKSDHRSCTGGNK